MNELCKRGASELAQMIRRGEVASREVVDAHLARIDEVNGYVNAVTVALADTARAAADAVDATPVDQRSGAFCGVPFTAKENIDCTGSPTTNGVPALANALPEADAPIVERMKRAAFRWRAPTCRRWARAWTPTIRCAAAPATRGTGPSRRAARAAAMRRRWQWA